MKLTTLKTQNRHVPWNLYHAAHNMTEEVNVKVLDTDELTDRKGGTLHINLPTALPTWHDDWLCTDEWKGFTRAMQWDMCTLRTTVV